MEVVYSLHIASLPSIKGQLNNNNNNNNNNNINDNNNRTNGMIRK